VVDEPLDRRLRASPDRTLRSAYFCGSLAVLIEKLKSDHEALCFRLGPLNSGPCDLLKRAVLLAGYRVLFT
jgi:hypothetical protein